MKSTHYAYGSADGQCVHAVEPGDHSPRVDRVCAASTRPARVRTRRFFRNAYSRDRHRSSPFKRNSCRGRWLFAGDECIEGNREFGNFSNIEQEGVVVGWVDNFGVENA